MEKKTQIELLKECRANGTFHHATIRNLDRCYGGLYFYVKATEENGGFRGYKMAGSVSKDSPDFDKAIDMVKGTGISMGAYGEG